MKKISTLLSLMIVALLASQTAFGQARITPLNIKQRTLKNGLQVISVQDKSSPTATVQVWYGVGSKDDPQGRSGFAHMFEHMMFKATKNMKNEMFDRLTEDVGGWNNASTWDDLTNYYQEIPSNYVETLLWAEAERMQNLNVEETVFASERDVVKEEFRQRVLADPYGSLFRLHVEQLSYDKHPYKRPGIGNLEELSAASLEDARKFYKDYYRPDNATLIVVGDFDQKQLDSWIDKYFGGIEKPKTPITRVNVVEPERSKEMRYVKTAPNVPLPALAITYHAPPAKSADVPALEVAQAILSSGESSRLYESLIRNQQIASDANFYTDIRQDKGLLVLYAIASEGKNLEDIEKSLLAEIGKMQNAPVSAKELEKAKNKMITNILRERETNVGKANAIGRAVIFQNDPNAVNTDIQKLQSVTAADVQRVMKKYFKDNNRVVIYYKNQETKEEAK